MESTPFSIFCYTICRNHFRSWDHLRSNLGIICGTGIICGPGSFAGPYRSAILVSQISTDLNCDRSDHTKLWAGTVIFGISMASVFPSAINFAEYFVTVSGKTASVLLVAASFGEMLIPLAVGNTIVHTSVGLCLLMVCAFVISMLTLLTYLLIVGFSRYFKRKTGFSGMLYQRNQEGVLANHDGDGDGSVNKQKVIWAKQWYCTCVLNLGTFLCRPLQNNNVKWPCSMCFKEREPQWVISRILFQDWTLSVHV